MTTEKPGNPGSYKIRVLLLERDVCVTASSTARTSNSMGVGSGQLKNLRLDSKLKKKKSEGIILHKYHTKIHKINLC
jgi:hypothetical protein